MKNSSLFHSLLIAGLAIGSCPKMLPINYQEEAAKIRSFGQKKATYAVRMVKCAFKPKQNNCSPDEIKKANQWVNGAAAATVTAAATVAAVAVTKKLIDKKKKKKNIEEFFNQIDKLNDNFDDYNL